MHHVKIHYPQKNLGCSLTEQKTKEITTCKDFEEQPIYKLITQTPLIIIVIKYYQIFVHKR